MANEKHLLLTADGGYSATAAKFTGEIWQVGIRLALVFGEVDDVGTLPNNWEPVATAIARTETSWDISGNWSISGPAGATFHADDFLNDQAGPAFAAWLAASSCFSTRVQLRTLKIYPIGTTGRAVPAPPYAVGTPVTLTYTGTLPTGGDSGSMVPPQDSVVASHRTGQIGRRGRGRMYLPPCNASAINEGALGATNKAALLANQVTLLEALAISVALPTPVTTRPIVTGAPWASYATIKSVRVGDLFDTQRRRRAQASETYTASAVTY